MDPFRPRPDALPTVLPIFPLAGALLLPGARLPLNIFEPRFLAMVEEALAGGRLIGMVLPDPALPRLNNRSIPYRTGCLGRIASFAETEDGRYLITLRGLARFDLLEELPETPREVRRVRPGYGPYLADLDENPAHAEPDRTALMAALRPYFHRHGIEADWAAVERAAPDALVTTLCMICPFSDAEKQTLLIAPDAAKRAELLISLLRIDSAGPAAGGRPS
ncbi:LON peptidase substrate-binding domain-containing protein [Pseudoroseomonas globiformis]|uniref:LON peptidase substrate-binding domain-containing protein n=1 Tax=Teichococcus globiformis TaxID=2307229 RepID=A0ABV7FZT7_9PROT